MKRELQFGIITLTASILITMMLFFWFQQSQASLSIANLFLYISVPSVIIITIMNPQAGFIALLFFVSVSPTIWADGVPILNFEYPYLKPGVNLFDGLLLAVTLIQLSRNRLSVKNNKFMFLTLLAYIVFTITSVQISTYTHSNQSVYSLYILLDVARLLLLVFNMASFQKKHYEYANVTLMAASVILVLYMFSGQAIANVESRLSTLGLGPNGIGGFFPLLIPLSLTFIKSESFYYRIGGTFSFVLLWIGLLLSQSRSGMLAAAVGSALVLLFIAKNKLRVVLLLTAIFVAVMMLASQISILSRFSSDADNGRLDLWIYSIKYVKENIFIAFFGIGPGMYYEFALQYLGEHIGFAPEHAHNYLITKFMENGLLALLLEVALAVIPIYLIIRKVRKIPVWLHGYWVGLLSYQIHAIADYTLWLHKISFVYWFFVFSLWYMYRELINNEERMIPGEDSDDLVLPRKS